MIRLRCFYLFMLFVVIWSATKAQNQSGLVRTLKRSGQKSQPLSGVTIRTKGGHNAVLSKEDGTFGIQIQGQAYILEMIRKQGYVLKDPEMQGRRYAYSSSVPLTIVMVSTKQLQSERQMISDKLYKEAEQVYLSKISNLERQRESNAIIIDQYRQKMQELQENYEKYQLMIEDLADHYARVDYDELDKNESIINQCIENGELEKAYSLIQQLGILQQIANIESRMEAGHSLMEDATQEMADVLKQQERDANYLYELYTIELSRLNKDKARYYIELRAKLDTTNVEWQTDAGNFLLTYFGNYTPGLAYLTKALKLSKAQYGKADAQTASCYNNIGEAYRVIGEYSKALAYLDSAFNIKAEIYENNHTYLATLYNNIGKTYTTMGRLRDGLPYCQKALAIRRQDGTSCIDLAKSLGDVGLIYYQLGKLAESRNMLEEALRIVKDNNIKTENIEGTVYGNLGNVYLAMGDYDNALYFLTKSAEVTRQMYGDKHPQYAMALGNMGTMYRTQEKLELAKDIHFKAFNLVDSLYGKKNPKIAPFYKNIGKDYLAIGENDFALAYMRAALKLLIDKFGENQYQLGELYIDIGNIYRKTRRSDDALKAHRKALDIYTTECSRESRHVGLVYAAISADYMVKQQYKEAIDNSLTALSIIEKIDGDEPSTTIASIYVNLGIIYHSINDLDRALKYLEKGRNIYANLGGRSISVANADYAIGDVYVQRKDFTKALRKYEDALFVKKNIIGENNLRLAMLYHRIGLVYRAMKDFKSAADNYTKELKIITDTIYNDRVYIADLCRTIGEDYGMLDDIENAKQYLKMSLYKHMAIRKIDKKVDNRKQIAEVSFELGILYISLGYSDNAVTHLERYVELCDEIGENDKDALARAFSILSDIYKADGDYIKFNYYAKRAKQIKK